MFTGLIEEVGKVSEVKLKGSLTLYVTCNKVAKDTRIGDSIAVNGVCLTVVSAGSDRLSFEVSEETVKRSNISRLKIGDAVNLERAMVAGGRFGGHIVQGHVDCVGYITSITPLGKHTELEVEIPPQYSDYVIEKGSIAIDGISLTVNYIKNSTVKLNIIPHTMENTNLKFRKTGDVVNLEFDILGKYVVDTMSKYGFSRDNKLKNLLDNW